MKIFNGFLPFLLIGFCSVNAQIPEGLDWELVEDSEDLSVYTRLAKGSKYKEIKMDFIVEASTDKILHYISIAGEFPNWVYSCKEAYSLNVEGKDIYYILLDMIWPISDRDVVQHSINHKDPLTGTIQIYTRAIKSDIPEKPNVVRIKENNIYWKLIPLENGHTRVLYYAINNPGGSVPAWLMNMVVTIGPRNTINRLINNVE